MLLWHRPGWIRSSAKVESNFILAALGFCHICARASRTYRVVTQRRRFRWRTEEEECKDKH